MVQSRYFGKYIKKLKFGLFSFLCKYTTIVKVNSYLCKKLLQQLDKNKRKFGFQLVQMSHLRRKFIPCRHNTLRIELDMFIPTKWVLIWGSFRAISSSQTSTRGLKLCASATLFFIRI